MKRGLSNHYMDEKTIIEALKKGERVTLECKKAKSEIPSSVWATYSSFANTEGSYYFRTSNVGKGVGKDVGKDYGTDNREGTI